MLRELSAAYPNLKVVAHFAHRANGIGECLGGHRALAEASSTSRSGNRHL